MAKYRITSIPQYRDGGMKKKKQPVVKSGWDSPVEGITPDNPLAAFMPNQPMVNQPTEYTIDPNQQDIPYNQRTGLEQLATQPEFGDVGYGYKRNRLTDQLELAPAGTPTYERDMFGRLITSVKASPDAPVDYEGDKLNCGPGKKPYKGVCLTEEEYAQVQAEEQANMSYWEQEEQKKIDAENEKRKAKETADFENEWKGYLGNATAKGNKHKKGALDPFRAYSKEGWENSGFPFQEWYDNEGKNQYYLEKKELKDGNYEINLYPREALYGMMSQYGVQPAEFEKYHGLNAKKVQEEFQPQLDYLHNYYVAQGADFIDEYTKQGLSAEEAKKKLIKDKNYGVNSGIQKNFNDVADLYDFENNADKYLIDNQGVLYNRDINGNLYKYTNQYDDDDFSVITGDEEDVNESPFTNANDKNYSKQGTFTWEPVDKSKVKTDSQGNIIVGDRTLGMYDYAFKGRDKKKDESTILTDYKNFINKAYKDNVSNKKVYDQQSIYTGYNAGMYDYVYGNSNTGKLDEIPMTASLTGGVNNDYLNAYNETVRKINAVTGKYLKKGVDYSDPNVDYDPEKLRAEQAKILEDFNKRVSKYNIKVGDTKINVGDLGGYEQQFASRNLEAYKNKDALAAQRNIITDSEAKNKLRYAYLNQILPTEENIINDQYRGEKESLANKYPSFDAFMMSPEGQRFMKTYKGQPSYGNELFQEAATIKNDNLAQDKWDAQVKLAAERMQHMQDNMPWYKMGIDQGMSLLTQPVDTFNQWSQGKLQSPLLGIIGDDATAEDMQQLESVFGTGASQVYYDKLNELYKNPVGQAVNIFNPFGYAAAAGRGFGRLKKGDPEASLSGTLMNTAFALLPVSKSVQALSATKLLPKVGARYLPQAVRSGKYVAPAYNATRNLITPGNALTGYFAKHAFIGDGDEPGFAITAGKNVLEGIENDDWGKVGENIVPLGMGLMIGNHAKRIGNQFSGNVLGKEALIPKLPIQTQFSNTLKNIIEPPQPYIHPTTGKVHFIRSKADLPFMNSNRYGLNYKQKGGAVLPKYSDGKPGKTFKLEVKPPKIPTRAEISKQLGDISFNQYLRSTAPETMDLIANLKNRNIIKQSLPEGALVTHPNLLNLATKRGIQDALTFSRSAAGTDYGISTSGTKTVLAPGDLDAYRKLGITEDPVAKGLYSASHVPWMRYGQRTGLFQLPYKTNYVKVYKFGEGEADYVVANSAEEAQKVFKNQFGQDIEASKLVPETVEQATSDSYDALYTYGNITGIPRSVKKGVFDDQYGTYTSILRYPFDYSGSANDMLRRFTDLENSTFANSKTLRRTAGMEGAHSGAIGSYNFTDKPTLENSFIAPLFTSSETPFIGRPGEKLLEPVSVHYKPELAEIDKESRIVRELYRTGQHEELINHLNDKIKAGQFGSIESNIQRIKEKPELTTFAFDRVAKGNNMSNNLYMNDIINPKTGLIDTGLTGTALEKLANLAYQSFSGYQHFGPRENAYYKTDNVVKIPYSPLRFKFKNGGQLPKARFGRPVKLPERIAPEPINEREYKFPSVQNRTIPAFKIDPQFSQSYWNTWNNLPQGGFHKNIIPTKPKLDQATRDLLKYPEFDVTTGESGAGVVLPTEQSKYLGDFTFKDFSDGWQVRNDMMNAFDKPQRFLKYNKDRKQFDDFYNTHDFNTLLMDQMDYDLARMKFDEMYPEEPGAFMMNALTGNRERDENFANLFPNVGLPNFRNKFTTPEQEAFIQEHVGGYNPSVRNRGMLSTPSLKTINAGLETVPRTFKELQESLSGTNWMATAPAKDVVMEMRGGLGLKMEDIKNATPEQLEKWRQKIVKKMNTQASDRWTRDSSNPFTGSDAWRMISKQAGYKNKLGGVSMKLSKSEIDKYIKGGYIVEDE